MIEINTWLDTFLQTLNQTFPDRILFVGLQGSYGRAEATETSDIDIVVILDELSAPDLQTYGAMICFDQTGKYYRHQKELLRVAGPEECAILHTFIGFKNGAPVQFREQSEALFTWSQKWIGVTNRK